MGSGKIYWMFLIIGLILGILLYLIIPGDFSPTFLIFFSLIPFFFFAAGFQGLIWKWVKPRVKEGYIGQAIVMGVIFVFLLLLHCFLILPLLCPDFLD